jgi:2',3'-cyclic-nucleotide 2'-phosphodiesterase (5'-nucleotidase family)
MQRNAPSMRRASAAVVGAAMALTGLDALADYRLTVLHNNDGESQLINAGSGIEDFGGIARFGAVVRDLRAAGREEGGVVLLSSGDNFLAGPEWNVSLEQGTPYFDAIGLDILRYDAFALGNHEFDFNPDVLCDFISSFSVFAPETKFLSANLDFSNEPCLLSLRSANQLGNARIVRRDGQRIGIVGATTEDLDTISSPRDVIINPVLPAVQQTVDALTRIGVDKIVLISHLQSINEELELVSQLRDVDIVIAGGGDELLGKTGDLVVPVTMKMASSAPIR